ncbi:MAG: hypothetical protein Tsb009_18450 [Planctomycetaceae bacterium]
MKLRRLFNRIRIQSRHYYPISLIVTTAGGAFLVLAGAKLVNRWIQGESLEPVRVFLVLQVIVGGYLLVFGFLGMVAAIVKTDLIDAKRVSVIHQQEFHGDFDEDSLQMDRDNPRTQVKIRCLRCYALNTEVATYCASCHFSLWSV